MADDNKQKEEQKKEANKQLDPICALSVPTIITALHQNALAHCDAASKNVRLLNSAINEKDDGKLKSAGEHIISVIPLKEGEPVEKKTAIEVIKQYVQWFVGPDLANKINDSTVKSLNETPGTENNKQDDNKENKEVKESHILSFSQYLLEADDSDDISGSGDDSDDETGEGDDSDDETGEGNDDDDTSGEGDDSDDSSGEGTDGKGEDIESKIGYYIAYNLKVDGLKSTALKDAMKKFAATLFDDLKITGDGLFGGGQSFTVGDIKKVVGDLFGNIDPDDLKHNISNKLEKKYDGTNTHILSKEKILRQYKKQLDVKQKAAIDAAENSVVIEVPNKIKKELNTRIIADIVTSSIKGLFKKFKHQIKKDDIIQISIDKNDEDDDINNKNNKNNKDVNTTDILSKPSPEKFERCITRKYNNFVNVYDYLSTLVEKIKNDKKIKDNKFAQEFVTIFNNQKKQAGDLIYDKTDLKDASVKKMVDHFRNFIDEYTKLYNKYNDNKETSDKKQLSEMEDIISSIIQEAVMRRFYGNVDRHRDRIKTKNDIMSILLGPDYSLNEDSEDDQLNSSGNETEEDETGSGDESTDSSADSSTNNTNNEKDETDDVYIIPMKGLKSKDD